jgi:hypothetical protein
MVLYAPRMAVYWFSPGSLHVSDHQFESGKATFFSIDLLKILIQIHQACFSVACPIFTHVCCLLVKISVVGGETLSNKLAFINIFSGAIGVLVYIGLGICQPFFYIVPIVSYLPQPEQK